MTHIPSTDAVRLPAPPGAALPSAMPLPPVQPPVPPKPRRRLPWPLRALAALGAWLLALLIVFEEWGWVPLQALLARLGRWPGLRWVEARVQALPPWAALLVFALPAALLLPVKLLALWAVGHGHMVLGMAVIVLAKVAGTAVVARLFTLTQPALLQLPWFAWGYAHWLAFKERLLLRVRASWPWRLARVLKRQAQRSWRAMRLRLRR